MIFRHPCKYCIVRAACTMDCDRVNKYGQRIDDIIDSKTFINSLGITVSLFIIAIYVVLCYFLSSWWLTTVPVLWISEYVLLRYNDFDVCVGEEPLLTTIASILMILPAGWIIILIMRWEKYDNKYRPSMKENHDTLVL